MAGDRQGCMNIGPDAIRLRRRAGVFAGVIAAALLATLAVLDLPALARLLIFPVWFTSALGFLQAREKT